MPSLNDNDAVIPSNGESFANQHIDDPSCICPNQEFLMSKNPPTKMQLAILELSSLVSGQSRT